MHIISHFLFSSTHAIFGEKRKNHFSLLFSDFRFSFLKKKLEFFLLKHETKCTFVEFSMKTKTLFCIVNLH